MKPLFEILPDSIHASNCTLVCDISKEGFSYAIRDDLTNLYIAVAIFEFEHGTQSDDFEKTLETTLHKQHLLQGKFKKVFIIYSYTESVLMPFELYHSRENEQVLKLVHGDLDLHTIVFTDIITEYNIYNIYRVPQVITSVIKSKFPEAVNRHRYSVLLKQFPPSADKLSVIFYPKKILVTLNKNGRTQLVNSFYYTIPTDVSYILLNICKQFEIENIPVEMSGLIEKDSALYKEIYNYFETVRIYKTPSTVRWTPEIGKQPAHFFSPIFAADSCE